VSEGVLSGFFVFDAPFFGGPSYAQLLCRSGVRIASLCVYARLSPLTISQCDGP